MLNNFSLTYYAKMSNKNKCEMNYEITGPHAKEYTYYKNEMSKITVPLQGLKPLSLKWFLLLQAIFLIHVFDNVCFFQDDSVPK